MRRTQLAALAFATLAAVAPTADAGPPSAGPTGFTCGMTAGTNPNAEADTKLGLVYGGPLAGAGTIVCGIQAGYGGRHDVFTHPSVSGGGAAPGFLPVTFVSFMAPDDTPVWLCTKFVRADGSVLYWHSTNGNGPGHWSTDPASDCALGISQDGTITVVPEQIVDEADAPPVVPPGVDLGDRYAAGGTTVARQSGQTAVDNGFALCDATHRAGTGGVCLPFTGGNGVHVLDAVHGENVAFQVCVDNNHDNFCGFNPFDVPASTGPCADDIVFSHDDNGAFHNPVGPVPTGFRAGCAQPAGARSWNGYVVILCEGAHDTHQHPATTGVAKVDGAPEGTGTFCGIPDPAPGKLYAVV
jgi:hypothetical protein